MSDEAIPSTYRRSADAMRDTAKWLVALVPGAGTVLVATQLLPVIGNLDTDDAEFSLAVALLAAAAVAVGVLVWLSVRVLRVGIAGWNDFLDEASSGRLDQRAAGPEPDSTRGSLVWDLDASGLLRLYGHEDTRAFVRGLVEDPGSYAEARPLVGTAIVEFADYRATRGHFVDLLRYGGPCLLVVLLCTAAVFWLLSDNPVGKDITSPIEGAVHLVSAAAADEVASEIECAVANPLPAWAIAGTVAEPEIVVASGPCVGKRFELDTALGSFVPRAGA